MIEEACGAERRIRRVASHNPNPRSLTSAHELSEWSRKSSRVESNRVRYSGACVCHLVNTIEELIYARVRKTYTTYCTVLLSRMMYWCWIRAGRPYDYDYWLELELRVESRTSWLSCRGAIARYSDEKSTINFRKEKNCTVYIPRRSYKYKLRPIGCIWGTGR